MRIVRALFLAFVLTGSAPAWADTPVVPAGDQQAIQQVISDQMAAFRRDDGAAAMGFASPTIQGIFGHDPDQFLAMVRRGYQPVYRPSHTSFGIVETVNGQVVQHVVVQGADGASHTALYMMERQADGTWRISGCVLAESDATGA